MARDRIDRMRSLFLSLGGTHTPWQPLVDVYRTRDGWLVKADLAGVRPEDISVSVQGSRLHLRGTRRDCTFDEGCRHYRLEISYSHFERTLELPDDLEQARITTEFDRGMLHVRIQTGNEGRDEHG